MKLSVLMTVYNEADFVEYAIRSCLPHVDHLVIVEGAYQETIKLGASPRSDDGTADKIYSTLTDYYGSLDVPDFRKHGIDERVYYIEANEHTDKDQRNVGLEKIKELNPDGWLLIIDGDEVYTKDTLGQIKMCAHTMDRQGKMAAYFKSLTFVNDPTSCTEQDFPRLFKITPGCEFTNDNFMEWPDKGVSWFSPAVMKLPYVRYHHYAFCKGSDRFKLKEKWWKTRFGRDFDYGWHVNEDGLIDDPNHKIYEYTGKHPDIMREHPLWR
jgi:glycosyltransferase involved in cell wall biosynthesis